MVESNILLNFICFLSFLVSDLINVTIEKFIRIYNKKIHSQTKQIFRCLPTIDSINSRIYKIEVEKKKNVNFIYFFYLILKKKKFK